VNVYTIANVVVAMFYGHGYTNMDMIVDM